MLTREEKEADKCEGGFPHDWFPVRINSEEFVRCDWCREERRIKAAWEREQGGF